MQINFNSDTPGLNEALGLNILDSLMQINLGQKVCFITHKCCYLCLWFCSGLCTT